MGKPGHDQADERFARNLKTARERAGLSQTDLAEKMSELGYPMRQQTVARVEAGERTVRGPGELLAFSRAVGSYIDAMVRPAGLQAEAYDLLDAAARVREGKGALRRYEASVRHLRRQIEKVTEAGNATALSHEMAVARHALKETEGEVPGDGSR